jgi:hypothetical protein
MIETMIYFLILLPFILAIPVMLIVEKYVGPLVERIPHRSDNYFTTGFDEKMVIDFICKRLSPHSRIDRDTVTVFVESEWDWQYRHAKKRSGVISLINRQDARLTSYLASKVSRINKLIREDDIKLLIKYLEEYEETLT